MLCRVKFHQFNHLLTGPSLEKMSKLIAIIFCSGSAPFFAAPGTDTRLQNGPG
jgi:hypothetical protein